MVEVVLAKRVRDNKPIYLTLDACHVAMNNGYIKKKEWDDFERFVVFGESDLKEMMELEKAVKNKD